MKLLSPRLAWRDNNFMINRASARMADHGRRLISLLAVGADAEIFVFDYERYRGEVVPALVELLRTGEAVPWLAEVFQSAPPLGEHGYDVQWPRLAAELRERPTDLARFCTWLGNDLRYLGAAPVDRISGTQLACPSRVCAQSGRGAGSTRTATGTPSRS